MNARRTLALTRRLMLQFRHDRPTLALLFFAPLVILGLLGYLLRGGGEPVAMAVVDLDGGPAAAAVVRHLESASGVSTTLTDAGTAEARLRDGAIAGYLVLPAGFGVPPASGPPPGPTLWLEGSEPGAAAAVSGAVAGALQPAGPNPGPGIQVRRLHGGGSLDTLDEFGAGFIGVIVFFLVFVITSVSFLRERSQGTLERLMASPLRRAEIVLGYMLGFTAVALVQSALVLAFSILVLKIHSEGSVAIVFGLEALMAVVAVNLGIFLSMFARTEFQAVQFIPLVILPQFILSGVLFPVVTEPRPLQVVSHLLPLTYAVEAMRDVMLKGAGLGSPELQRDIAVIVGVAVLLVIVGSTTLRRRIA